MATYTVTTRNDELLEAVDADGLDGNGLSLREAIALANLNPGRDTVVFDSNLTNTSLTLLSGDIQISDDLDIEGDPAIAIEAQGNSRLFVIDDGNVDETIEVRITETTLRDGYTADNGGAILNQEVLILEGSAIENSNAGRNGGAIFNTEHGEVTIKQSTIRGNTAGESGGGIFNTGIITVESSSITQNESNTGAGISNGVESFPGTLTASNTTITQNTATTAGGGISNDAGTVAITSSVIASNTAGNLTSADVNGSITFISDSLIGINFSSLTNSFESFLQGNIVEIDAVPSNVILGQAKDDEILGTDENDLISGFSGVDKIKGEAGDDLINGGINPDNLNGGSGSDTLFGNRGSDTLIGGSGRDLLLGGNGKDRLRGGDDRDLLAGGAGRDRLNGDGADDVIIGGRGHDTLRGGNGSDALVGVDLSQGFGVGERDVLFGGEGADFFSLGDEMVLYYDDGDLLTDGRNDYAFIRDFETGVDRIIIFGSFSDYTLNEVSGDTEIFTNGDLIAIVKGVTGLNSENFA